MQGHAYNELLPRGEPGFPMELYHLDPGHIRYVMPYHWHMEYELVRVLSGGLSIWLNGALYELSAGDLLWVEGGVLHTGIPGEGCIYECLVFDLDFLLKACGGWSKHLTDLSEHSLFLKPLLPRDSSVLRQADELFLAVRQQKKGSRLRAFGALCGLLGLLIEMGWYSAELPENEAQRRNIRLLKRLFAYLEEHYAEPLTLAQLAGKLACRRNTSAGFPLHDPAHTYRLPEPLPGRACLRAAVRRQKFRHGDSLCLWL